MPSSLSETLPPELELALAHTPLELRSALRTFFELDCRFSRILAGTNEPMLGQMRLAWWRDTLAKPVSERPGGDGVLDAIARHWEGRESQLVKLVDGWENLLVEPPLGPSHALAFATGRADAMGASFQIDFCDWVNSDAHKAALRWALADLAANVSDADERKMLLQLANEQPFPGRLSGPFKGIAILGALALRSLENEGRPLMEGRGASLAAFRAAIFGG